jgi:MFS family permease
MPMATTALDSVDESKYPKPAYAWYVVSLICVGYVFAFMDRIIVGLLTTSIQRDLMLTDTQMGVLQGIAFALFYTLFGIPIGWLVDRWHRKTILGIGMVVWSVTTAACGYATSFWTMFLARVGVGIGEATLNPCASSMIGDYFPPRTRAKAFGVYVMGTAIGTGITYLGGGLLLQYLAQFQVIDLGILGEHKYWEAMFVFVGLAGLIPAVIFMLTVQEPERKDLGAKEKGKASMEEIKAFFVWLACGKIERARLHRRHHARVFVWLHRRGCFGRDCTANANAGTGAGGLRAGRVVFKLPLSVGADGHQRNHTQ